eukprot:gnl/MRDRNA2_/MRDRNA2_44639_c0_seq1.p1 gnl/MRDRNA2_/MRDRNA2_44639_c0~~gnl/MRDRNA2_/MRDRNA2_44639_c0_seq1.p1  ORF type:complete len:334 (-),score=56.45 gnl/MRDRNA2_/MRDRNA2_44639_c0_seq1:356-1285(-)
MSHLLGSVLKDHPHHFLAIGSFLDKGSLAFLEQACLLHPRILDLLWQKVAAHVFANSAVWCGGNVQTAMKHLKEHSGSWKVVLRELNAFKTSIFPPEAWRPWISKTSECGLTVNPFPEELTETLQADFNLSPQASVPVGLGAFRGQSLVVCISIRTERLLEDNVCIGIEAIDCNRAMSIMIAPMSGHCFIQHCDRGRHNGPTMRTAALPPLADVPETLHVWMQLTEKGGVRFLRQADDREPEDAGIMGPERFPLWITEYYACVHFWGYALQSAAGVSIEYAGDTLPSWFVDKSVAEMDTTWELLNAELW